MNKKERHKQDLLELLKEYLRTGDFESLTQYLLSNSDLPGRRANLELAAAFGDIVEEYAEKEQTRLWELCVSLSAIPPDEAPVNDPREFLPFCGAIGIGTIGSVCLERFDRALGALRDQANDSRWRMREAVCFALQRLMAKRDRETLKALEGWILDGSLLEMRAVGAAVAEPVLLRDEETARWSLRLHQAIVERAIGTRERRSQDFKTLRKALGYTISVVAQALPNEGFAFLGQLAASQDPDLRWIAKQNLRKNRLAKRFPEQVRSALSLLA